MGRGLFGALLGLVAVKKPLYPRRAIFIPRAINRFGYTILTKVQLPISVMEKQIASDSNMDYRDSMDSTKKWNVSQLPRKRKSNTGMAETGRGSLATGVAPSGSVSSRMRRLGRK